MYSKYKNKKVEWQGIKFDSIKERDRYLILKDMERLGQIEDLQLQVKYELQASYEINGKKRRSISYIADFVYFKIHNKKNIQIKELIVEDCKGFKTDIYKLKKKLFEYKYGVEINEV